MANATTSIPASQSDQAHPPHLAHHYDTPQQQFQSGKLGMWIFLATEILMFGGLFCAYAVYRANHPDVFQYAHHYLDKTLGGINTVVLIASSFTMAWAVRCAQINRRRGLLVCLGLTLLGACIFMGIKAVEYHHKWKHHLGVGSANMYHRDYKAADAAAGPTGGAAVPTRGSAGAPSPAGASAGTAEEWNTKPPPGSPPGLATDSGGSRSKMQFHDLARQDRERVSTFFSIYFGMTGLHGLHVLIGMGLITWLIIRSAKGAFSSAYYTPVELGGLYWHLVDLIWIFLFPLLYLIH